MKTPILHARVQGSGPVVILLHGFLSSSEYWKKVADISESDRTIIALDLLGFGKSPKPIRSSYDYDAQIKSINATLNSLNIKQPFTLVGHSMGSLIALRYARLYEAKVAKLILVNLPVMLGKSQVRSEILNTSFVYKYGLQPYTHRVAWSIFKTLFALRLLSDRRTEQLKQNAYFFEHSPLSRIKSFQRIIADARADIDLRLVNVRTVVLSGLNDRKVYLDNLMHNVALSSAVELQTVPTGHHIPRALPRLLAEKISQV